eukprot:CAMPEP_0185033330 /NCGR_PEP_ID=MMETSP1103-20130426/22140_1 /TAXON_ID=36769 /ORGANISM="Paraphysomonas bandaiensis, Strain Caron Lab Isolate" /LENGTH=729 /DNA_ID=CAMNT_0027569553 /DNA_START=153 /DNA_END=2342 /DNA_ORIENTATION=+
MFDPEESNRIDDYYDCLGVDDCLTGRDFGRDRGRNPDPTESQRKTIEKLASKLYTRPPKNKNPQIDEDQEDILEFDLMDTVRVILFDGRVLKKSLNCIVNHTNSRHMFLFNDILIITSCQNTTTKKLSILKMSEKYAIHQVLPLDRMAIHSKSIEEPDNPCAFDVHMPERVYTIIAESESDKRIWLEEIELAIYAWHAGTPRAMEPGWQHEAILGTLWSDALLGNLEGVRGHLEALSQSDPDTVLDIINAADSSGMNPLHWAALRGHFKIIKLLLEAGCEVDALNNGLNSPLLIAASRGHDSAIRLLLDRGADVTLRNLKDRDVLFMAALYGHVSKGLGNTLQMLHFNNVNFDQLDSTGSAPLHECAARNLSRPVRLLVLAGAHVNTKHGRTGVTPLQLACSVENPDVETVRSFLDNGAHPNWKDASGRSAFNMVLYAHSSEKRKETGEGNSAADGSSPDAMQERVQQYGTWVLRALPVLLEIVRKGGRYTEDSIADLRDSFKEAIDAARLAWHSAKEPDNFEEFIATRDPMISQMDWVDNNASDYCMLCVDKFTYSNRRHHCRGCGTLCCAPCSTKRLPLQPQDRRGSGAKGSGDRVCDGCFNRLTSEATARNLAMAKAKKDLLLQMEREKEMEHGELLEDSGTGNSLSTGEHSKIDDVKDTLGATGEALKERGEKLTTLADKSEKLDTAAAEYNRMAKQLLSQQQERVQVTSSWRKKKSSSAGGGRK